MAKRRTKKHRKSIQNQNHYKEEYALEVAPPFFMERTMAVNKIQWFNIPVFSSAQFIGYFALFIALLSIGMYPLLFGVAGLILGITTVTLKEDTLGYTAIVFSLFSILFSLLYQPLF